MENKLKIVYVPRRSRIRPYKIAKALKYTEKVEQVLVCEESFYASDLHDGLFDRVHFFTKKNFLFKLPKAEKIYRRINERFGFGFKKMIKQIRLEDPDIVFCFAEPYNHIEYILRKTEYKVILCDGADFTGISEGIENLSSRTLELEKFCFENVDGIVYKGPNGCLEYYRNYGYEISGTELSWFDHCDTDLFMSQSKKYESKELHLVYTGNVSGDPESEYCYFLPLAKSLEKQKIHFHIYPNPFQYSRLTSYKDLDENSIFFHFHKPLPLHSLIKEISKYSVGLWIHLGKESKRVTSNKAEVGIGNKLFTYLEAGLPIAVSDSRKYGAAIVNKNKIGFSISDEQLDSFVKYLKTDELSEYSSNVKLTRDKYSLSNNSQKIYDFCRSIIDSKK